MKSYLNKILWLVCILVLAGCKKEKALEGPIQVTGKVTDNVSQLPLNNVIVSLVGIEQRSQEIGGYADFTKVVATDTTDSQGNYSLSYTANRQYKFEVIAEPNSPYYIWATTTINSTGNHTRDFGCERSATAKITVTNVSPVDTPYTIILESSYENIRLHQFYKDTVVHLKLVGNRSETNLLSFHKSYMDNRELNEKRTVNVGPWDTVLLQYKY